MHIWIYKQPQPLLQFTSAVAYLRLKDPRKAQNCVNKALTADVKSNIPSDDSDLRSKLTMMKIPSTSRDESLVSDFEFSTPEYSAKGMLRFSPRDECSNTSHYRSKQHGKPKLGRRLADTRRL